MTLDVDDLTVPQLLRAAARETPDAPFIHLGDVTRSYAQIDEMARRYAAPLADAGVRGGELVGIMMTNRIEFVELYAALAYCGAAVVLINPDYRGYLLEYVLDDAKCAIVLADGASIAELRRSSPKLSTLATVLSVDDVDAGESTGPLTVRRLRPDAHATEPLAYHDVSPRDLHCVVYSSGTTGPSKGIMISHAHALVKALEVIRICGFTRDDILYSPLPLFYSMGLLRGVLSVALMRSAIILREKFSVSQYWDDIRRHGATVAHSVFSLPVMLASAPPSPGDRDHTLRRMFNARHDPAFEERFGVRLIEGYGLTEAGNAIYSRWDEPAVAGSCGRISDEWEIRLTLPDESEATVGQTGEIHLRPRLPNRIMIGYLNKPEANAEATRDLWFRTGDLASRDAAGNYYYSGRIKEMIRRRGQNISAWEVEKIVTTFDGVVEAAALAHPAEVGDDDLRVIVVGSSAEAIDLTRLAQHCARNMPPFMVPRYFEQRDELPKTPSGRVEKYKLSGSPLGAEALDRGDRTRRESPRP